MLFELGEVIVKIALRMKIEDQQSLSIASDLFEFAEKLKLSESEGRSFRRKFQALGDSIADSCREILEKNIEEMERQRIITNMLFQAIQSIEINKDLMEAVYRNPERLSKRIIDKCMNLGRTKELDPSEKELFDRLIFHISTILINAYNEWPELSSQRTMYIMDRLDTLMVFIQEVLSNLRNIEKSVENAPREYRLFESYYKKNFVTQYNCVNLYGVDERSSSKKYKLVTAYVNLSADYSRDDRVEERTIDVSEIFTLQRKNVWISGEAGSGKTTCLSWLGVQAASAGRINGIEDAIPVVVELRSVGKDTASIVIDCLKKVMAGSTYSIPEGWLESKVEEGKILFLFDGVDEIVETEREKIFEQIIALDPEEKCYKVFSSRPQVEIRPDLSDLLELRLQAMRMPQIEKFVRYWHNAVIRDMLKGSEEEAKKLAEDLLKKIRATMAIRRLSGTPLLSALLCSLHATGPKSLPSNKRDLYESCCRMLLHRELDKDTRIDDFSLAIEEKNIVLSVLAYHMMRNGFYGEISEEEAEVVFRNIIRDMSFQGRKLKMGDAGKLLAYFLNRSGIIHEVGRNIISFVHLSFQEYYCALEIKRQEDWGYIREKVLDDNWLETISIAIGYANNQNSEAIIRCTLDKGETDSGLRARSALFALEYLSGGIDVSNRLRLQVQRRGRELIPPSMDNCQAVSRCGEIAIPRLAYNPDYSTQNRIGCLTALSMMSYDPIQIVNTALSYLVDEVTEPEVSLIGEVLHRCSLEQLKDEQIPGEIISCYARMKIQKMIVSLDIICCFNLCTEKEMEQLLKSIPRQVCIVDSVYRDDKDNKQRNMDGYLSFPKSFAERFAYVEVKSDYIPKGFFRDFWGIKSLRLKTIFNNSVIDSMNACGCLYRSLSKCSLKFVESEEVDMSRMSFLVNCKELAIEALDDAFLSFYMIENFKQLEKMSINMKECDAKDANYNELLNSKSLKKLVIHCYGGGKAFQDDFLEGASFSVEIVDTLSGKKKRIR